MKKVIYGLGQRIPIKLWLDDIEEGALDQAINLANLPFATHHIAIMPDSHQGYGMPIGGVMATEGIIVPNAVGVDIGCGMLAFNTQLTELSKEDLKCILGEIRNVVPVGFKKHKDDRNSGLMPISIGCFVVNKEYDNAVLSLGTLGGGNHFIEIQKSSEGNIWIMVHSGSRNLGKQVADFYNRRARELNNKWSSSVPEKWDLAFLPLDTDEGQEYLLEMEYCVEYAYKNRRVMLSKIISIFEDRLSLSINRNDVINIAHNYARLENHFGQNVVVHRKGATSAKEGEFGIIPGSQGTKSYIVIGKGNKESFESCSHGAGRKMGRKQAQRELNLEEEQRKLDEQGILHAIRGVQDLDEASGAYKDIDIVMKNQEDLVEIVTELTPLAVIKG